MQFKCLCFISNHTYDSLVFIYHQYSNQTKTNPCKFDLEVIEYISLTCQLKLCVNDHCLTPTPSVGQIYSLDCVMLLKSCYTRHTGGVIGIELSIIIAYSLTHSSWHVCVDVASRTIRLNTSLFWASLSASVGLIGSHFFMSSVHLLVGRPFLLLPSSLASNMCLPRESCLFRWPKYDSFLALMLFNNQSWSTFSSFRISVFFLFSIHGILSILLLSVDFLFTCCCQGPSFAPIYGGWKYECSNDFQLCLLILSFPDFFPFS